VDFACYERSSVAGNLREELGLPVGVPLVGTVAILRIKKGHNEILDAVPLVLQRFPDAHFVFAGDGPQTHNLKRRIAAEGLGGRVHMLGLRRDVTNVLSSLDVFVLPTHQEALGTAFIEAGAMGLPVVATNVDGVPEVVQDGTTGLLVAPNDGVAVGEAICTLLADPIYRQGMGANAAEFVRRKFSREAMAQGMEKLYQHLLNRDESR
jgi:glycosyltransferase involved in cell wall biosynthesis